MAITAQNTRGVRAVETVREAMVAAQLTALAEDLPPAALKTGMLAEASLVRLVAKAIRENGWQPLVVDPVMVATSGHRLLTTEAEDVIRESLLPLAALVTPNLDEAAVLTGRVVHDVRSMERAGETLVRFGAAAALVKGGHLPTTATSLTDVLVTPTASGTSPTRGSPPPPPTAPAARSRRRSPPGSRSDGRSRPRWPTRSTSSTARSPGRRVSAAGTGRSTTPSQRRHHPLDERRELARDAVGHLHHLEVVELRAASRRPPGW